jgi:hypothetical protein
VRPQQCGHGDGIADDARDVGRGTERSDAQRAIRIPAQFGLEMPEVDAAVVIFVDGDDVGDGLPPGQLIAVMLVWPDEYDRALLGGDVGREAVVRVEIGREPEIQDLDEFIDRPRRPGAGEDDAVVLGVAADGAQNQPPGVLAEARRLPPRARGLGMRIRIERHHLGPDEVLEERERTPAGRVIGIGDPPRPERTVDHPVVADDGIPDGPKKEWIGFDDVELGLHGATTPPSTRRYKSKAPSCRRSQRLMGRPPP